MRKALATIAAEQRTVGRALRKAVPGVVVTARLRYTLDALVVYAPAGSLQRLARVRGVEQVFRSASFHVETDRVPTVVNATPLWSPAPAFPDGTRGQGMRIGIIDDGIDIRRPSFSGAGYSYPPGFPKGLKNGVNGKVIVARAFAPPDSGPREHTAFDPVGSEHGTHVAGIAAGNSGITAMVDGVRVPNLSGVAPDAYLGSYRVLTTPTPTFGLDGNAAEIARAIDRAVGDGMDVLNLSLGEPEAGPGDDLVEQAIAGAARAGVPTVVAAGNEGDQGGFGTVSSPGSAADAITVAAVTNDRIFGLPLVVTGRVGPPFAVVAGPVAIPSSWGAGLPLRASTGCGSGATAGSLLLVHLSGRCTATRAATTANAADAAGLRARDEGAGRSAADRRRLALGPGHAGRRDLASHGRRPRAARRAGRRTASGDRGQRDGVARLGQRRPHDVVLVAGTRSDLASPQARRRGSGRGSAVCRPGRLRDLGRHQHGLAGGRGRGGAAAASAIRAGRPPTSAPRSS